MSVLVEIRSRIESTTALIVQYEAAISSDPAAAPPSLYANIRALEKLRRRLDSEFESMAVSQGLEVYRYRILNEDDEPALIGVAEAWAKFQHFFSSVYAAISKQSKGDLNKARGGFDVPQLSYGYTFAGSIGVVITLPRETTNLIGGESPLDVASEIVFDLIESKNLNETARRLGPLPIEALNEWVGVHSQNHFGMGLEWRSDHIIRRRAELEYSQLAALQTVIMNTEMRSTTLINGELRKVDLNARVFSIQADDGNIIEGVFEEAISPEHVALLPARYAATITRITKVVILGKESKTTVLLSKLESI